MQGEALTVASLKSLRRLLMCVMAAGWWCCQDVVAAQPARQDVVIELKGNIDARREKFLATKLHRARGQRARVVVLEIDSPGGLLDTSLSIAEMVRDVDWATTVAFIPEKALSGAALAALGCDEIYLAPTARMGDIGAIEFDTTLWAFRYAPAKVTSDLARRARDLAQQKGRPPELAEAMVDKDVLVYGRRDQQGRFVEFRTRRARPAPQDAQNGAAVAQRAVADWQPDESWQLIQESGAERFLTVNGARAVELGLANGLVTSREALKRKLQIDQSWTVYQYTFTDELVYWLNHPLITVLLFIVGLVAIYVELSAPGIGVGGLVGGLCFTLFFWSRVLGGTAGWLEIVLFLAGLVFLGLELFVIPGFGFAGLTGLLLLTTSLVMASQDFFVPHSAAQYRALGTSVVVVLGSVSISLVAMALLARHMGTFPVIRHLMLQPPAPVADGDGSGALEPPHRAGITVGSEGVADSVLRPAGRARFGGRSVDVVTGGVFVEKGTPVRVVEIHGNRVVVEPVEG